jgi:hypothetical protein
MAAPEQPRQRQTLDEALRRAVRDSGLSVSALSRRCDIPQPSLSQFVAGRRGLAMVNVQRLLDYFGLELRACHGSTST